MKFKACEARKTGAYYGVCEDFESKRNAEIRFLFAFLPIAIGFDKVDKMFEGLLLWNIALDALLAFIERNTSCASTDIAVVGICHLAWTIHDATHNANF